MRISGHRIIFRSLLALSIGGMLGVLSGTQPLLAQGKVQKDGMYRSDVFGAGWTIDSCANLQIGEFSGRTLDYRFRSDHTGTFSGLEIYFIFNTFCDNGCYADGNGGIIQIQVRTDDGTSSHLPSNTVLGTTVVADPLSQNYRLVNFLRPIPLASGTLYHIVFTNISGDPIHNYVSIDDLYTSVSGSDLQPATSEGNLAVLFRNGNNPLQVNHNHVPIFSVYFDDGFRQGQGYIDVRHNSMQIQSGGQVAEVFIVQDANHTVSQLAVRLDPLTNLGDIKVTLNNALEQPLATGTLELSSYSTYSYAWLSFSFAPLILTKGSSYSIELTAENGAQFLLSPIEQGAPWGFRTENLYTSQCQVRAGAKWSDCLGMSNLDLPFYFH